MRQLSLMLAFCHQLSASELQANMQNVQHRSSGMDLHMLRAQATKVKDHVELLHERKLCFDTVLQVPSYHTHTA